MRRRPTFPRPASGAALLALALATWAADAAAQPVDAIIDRAQQLKHTSPRPGLSLDGIIDKAQELKRMAAEAAARSRDPGVASVIERAQELKRKYAKEAPPPPAVSVGRILEQSQALKRQAAEVAEARNREAAALIQRVDRPPSPEEIQERKDAFIRERLDPMLGERRAFLIGLDRHIRANGLLAFVAGLSEIDRKTCVELIRITEEQRTLMATRPDLFTEDDLRSSQVLSAMLKILAE